MFDLTLWRRWQAGRSSDWQRQSVREQVGLLVVSQFVFLMRKSSAAAERIAAH